MPKTDYKIIRLKYLKYILLFILFFSAKLYSQTDTANGNKSLKDSADVPVIVTDSSILLNAEMQKIMREIADSISREYAFQFREKQIYSHQLNLLNELTTTTRRIEDYFKKGIDTAAIKKELKSIEEYLELASDGTIQNQTKNTLTFRNIRVAYLLMNELVPKLEKVKTEIKNHLDNLQKFRFTLDSLQTDSLLFKFAKDSAIFNEYLNKVIKFSEDTSPTDSSLTNMIKELQNLDIYTGKLSSNITAKINSVTEKKNIITFDRSVGKFSPLFDMEEDSVSFSKIIDYSYNKEKPVLLFYIENNLIKIIVSVLIFLFCCILIYDIKKRSRDADKDTVHVIVRSVTKHFVITSAFLTMMTCQFLFSRPPFIFMGGIWFLSSIILTIIIWSYYNTRQRIFWFCFASIYSLTFFIDLLLVESGVERILMLILGISGMTAGILAFRKQLLEKKGRIRKYALLIFTLVFLLVSVMANLSGDYNISKALLVNAISILMTAFLIYWAATILIKLTETAITIYENDGNENFRKKLHTLKTRIPVFVMTLAYIGWTILFLRNFRIYEDFTNGLKTFLEEERVIGQFTFTFENVLIFIGIIMLSTILSKVISFFADKSDKSGIGVGSVKGGLSNWMLLIRITVISGGVLLAFAASGFPMDKMAIVIGSLGVGIGFGLQTIFNNLISGILLAFEKPFRIGDQIEIAGQSGKIKEIGIRSSKISTPEGADLIIPNGDLLSKHVTNWTLRNMQKRSDMSLSFNYGSNLNELKKMFEDILNREEDISKFPQPEVLIKSFGGSSVEFRLLFWTDINNSDKVNSDLMFKIEEELRRSGIELKS
ncbi:MAG TPA: mechanosensitive ion channel [Ignavibacteria bacterium]|nr:mechanosensitive ion channel [Ignavibacteria bacterium]